MFRNRPSPWPSCLCVLLLLLTSWTVNAQAQRTPSIEKSKARQETCDGALDIVPSKAATFMRKRRMPSKKAAPRAESKSGNKAS
jgi:hypothetical protein